MQKPLVSIVIPVYNGGSYLRQAIESALDQTYENCEVIVVNDGSTDGGLTSNIALSFGEKIRYFEKENGGVASALNLGIEKMQGEYFCWLSHDDFYYKEKVEIQIASILKSPNNEQIIFCNYDILNEEDKKCISIDVTTQFSKEILVNSYFSVLTAMIQFGGVLLHKNLFQKYGDFNEKLITTQDYEFLFRVLKREKIMFIPDCLYCIRHHQEQGSRTIACHNKEIDNMYSMFLSNIEDDEKQKMFGSIYNYYYRLLWMIISQSQIVNAKKTCIEIIKKCDVNSLECEFNIKQALLKCTHGSRKKICIFGSGSYGKRLLFDLQVRQVDISCFIDNNPDKWNTQIEGIPCRKLSDLYKQKNEVLIIIAAFEINDIKRQLEEENFKYVITKKDIDMLSMMYPPKKRELISYLNNHIK